MKGHPSDGEQLNRLRAIKDRQGYGFLVIISRPGDVVFAVSPAPRLAGYEIVAAGSEGGYDIWKGGKLMTPDQSLQQIQSWIRNNTPVWLYDDSEVTEEQTKLVETWFALLNLRYPGVTSVAEWKR